MGAREPTADLQGGGRDGPGAAVPPGRDTRRREAFWFLALAVLVWPLIAIAVVGGYGFIVWMTQTFITGPPGPPA